MPNPLMAITPVHILTAQVIAAAVAPPDIMLILMPGIIRATELMDIIPIKDIVIMAAVAAAHAAVVAVAAAANASVKMKPVNVMNMKTGKK